MNDMFTSRPLLNSSLTSKFNKPSYGVFVATNAKEPMCEKYDRRIFWFLVVAVFTISAVGMGELYITAHKHASSSSSSSSSSGGAVQSTAPTESPIFSPPTQVSPAPTQSTVRKLLALSNTGHDENSESISPLTQLLQNLVDFVVLVFDGDGPRLRHPLRHDDNNKDKDPNHEEDEEELVIFKLAKLLAADDRYYERLSSQQQAEDTMQTGPAPSQLLVDDNLTFLSYASDQQSDFDIVQGIDDYFVFGLDDDVAIQIAAIDNAVADQLPLRTLSHSPAADATQDLRAESNTWMATEPASSSLTFQAQGQEVVAVVEGGDSGQRIPRATARTLTSASASPTSAEEDPIASYAPTFTPSAAPSLAAEITATAPPTSPTLAPSLAPSKAPTVAPSAAVDPTLTESSQAPSLNKATASVAELTSIPTVVSSSTYVPSLAPTIKAAPPSVAPSAASSVASSAAPVRPLLSEAPSVAPTISRNYQSSNSAAPTSAPTLNQRAVAGAALTDSPTQAKPALNDSPTLVPTASPSVGPVTSQAPSLATAPTTTPILVTVTTPTPTPTISIKSPSPTTPPTGTDQPALHSTVVPTMAPSAQPSAAPTPTLTPTPIPAPSPTPTQIVLNIPTVGPSSEPTVPTGFTASPSMSPTYESNKLNNKTLAPTTAQDTGPTETPFPSRPPSVPPAPAPAPAPIEEVEQATPTPPPTMNTKAAAMNKAHPHSIGQSPQERLIISVVSLLAVGTLVIFGTIIRYRASANARQRQNQSSSSSFSSTSSSQLKKKLFLNVSRRKAIFDDWQEIHFDDEDPDSEGQRPPADVPTSTIANGGHANGGRHANGHTNGHTDGHADGPLGGLARYDTVAALGNSSGYSSAVVNRRWGGETGGERKGDLGAGGGGRGGRGGASTGSSKDRGEGGEIEWEEGSFELRAPVRSRILGSQVSSLHMRLKTTEEEPEA